MTLNCVFVQGPTTFLDTIIKPKSSLTPFQKTCATDICAALIIRKSYFLSVHPQELHSSLKIFVLLHRVRAMRFESYGWRNATLY